MEEILSIIYKNEKIYCNWLEISVISIDTLPIQVAMKSFKNVINYYLGVTRNVSGIAFKNFTQNFEKLLVCTVIHWKMRIFSQYKGTLYHLINLLV